MCISPIQSRLSRTMNLEKGRGLRRTLKARKLLRRLILVTAEKLFVLEVQVLKQTKNHWTFQCAPSPPLQ